MKHPVDRRQFLKLAGLGGVVFASGLARHAGAAVSDDFYFVQLSDTHWGFEGPPNPDAKVTLPKTVATVNALKDAPDFIMFTGDLTHTTDDPKERRQRLAEFKKIVADLKVKNVHFMPGEHDASLDQAKLSRNIWQDVLHIRPQGRAFHRHRQCLRSHRRDGDEQLAWLAADLKNAAGRKYRGIYASAAVRSGTGMGLGDARRRQGDRLLLPHANVTVFYGHIHQEHHFMTGHIAHHAAKGLMSALPVAKSQPKRTPLPWDPAHPYAGLGFRDVEAEGPAKFEIVELPVVKAT
jgi:3',5'-cyclic AMP phosphodiesterase CpdA